MNLGKTDRMTRSESGSRVSVGVLGLNHVAPARKEMLMLRMDMLLIMESGLSW